MKVGFIGLGRMGSAIAGRVLAAGHDWWSTTARRRKRRNWRRRAQRSPARSMRRARRARSWSPCSPTMRARAGGIRDRGLVQSLPAAPVHMRWARTACRRYAGSPRARRSRAVPGRGAGVRPSGRRRGGSARDRGRRAASRCAAARRCSGHGPAHLRGGRRPGGRHRHQAGQQFHDRLRAGIHGRGVLPGAQVRRRAGRAAGSPHQHQFFGPVFKIYGQIMVDESYDQVGFTANLALKDANLVLAAADAARVPLACANVVRDRLLSAIAHGSGEKDWA